MARMLVFALFFLVATAGAHLGFVRWLLRSFPALLPRQRWIYRVVAVIAILPVLRILGRISISDFPRGILAVATMELMVVLVGTLLLAVLRLLVLAVPERAAVTPVTSSEDSKDTSTAGSEQEAATEPVKTSAPSVLGRRAAIERAGGLAIYGFTGSLLGWGMVRGRHEFALETLAVKIPGLPRALDGYTIAQISDIHVGPFVRERELDEGLDLCTSVKADLVVVTGDLVDLDPRLAALLVRKLNRLKPRDGIFAILGNHDHYAGAEAVAQTVGAAGIEVLVNRGLVVRPNDGGGFALLGVDDLWARKDGGGPDLAAAIAMVPPDRPRVLLAHQPKFFDESRGEVALQLSGHTHGGQINPGFRPADLIMEFVAGRYDRGDSTLYVNRGFGVAGPPSRIGAPPEVTKIVLVSA